MASALVNTGSLSILIRKAPRSLFLVDFKVEYNPAALLFLIMSAINVLLLISSVSKTNPYVLCLQMHFILTVIVSKKGEDPMLNSDTLTSLHSG